MAYNGKVRKPVWAEMAETLDALNCREGKQDAETQKSREKGKRRKEGSRDRQRDCACFCTCVESKDELGKPATTRKFHIM